MNRDLFIGAQAMVFERAMEELAAGKKQTHWMWVVFPQMDLGESWRSKMFALTADDAEEYVEDDELGIRLIESFSRVLKLLNGAVQPTGDATARELLLAFGDDAKKLRSSATLFAHLPGDNVRQEVVKAIARAVLIEGFARQCHATRELLRKQGVVIVDDRSGG